MVKECTICGEESKYACSRCGARSCSLPCSRTHSSSCSAPSASSSSGGVGRYIDMRTYGPETMYADYVYLSSLSRTAATAGAGASLLSKPAKGSSAREALRKQLHFRRVPMLLLPDGMQRRKNNLTAWNGKERVMRYTVAVKPDPNEEEEVRAHRVPAERTVAEVIAKHKGREGKAVLLQVVQSKLRNESSLKFLQWHHAQVERERLYPQPPAPAPEVEAQAPPEKEGILPQHVLDRLQALAPPPPPEKKEEKKKKPMAPKTYVRVDVSHTLEEALRAIPDGWAVVEYPTFELWEADKLDGLNVMETQEGQEKRKAEQEQEEGARKRLQVQTGSLVAYESSDEEEEQPPLDQTRMLASYDTETEEDAEEPSPSLADLAKKAGFNVTSERVDYDG